MIVADAQDQQLGCLYPAKCGPVTCGLPAVKVWKYIMPAAPASDGGTPILANPTLYSDPSTGSMSDGAASFSAANKEYLTIPSNASLNLGTGDFSLNMWIYRASAGARVLATKWQDVSNYWELGISAGNVPYFIAKIGGSTLISVAGTTSIATTSTWYNLHLQVSRSTAGSCKLYLNGTDDTAAGAATSASTIDNTGTYRLGVDGALAVFFDGRMDSASLRKALCTTGEITALYNAGAGRTYADLTAANGLDAFAAGLTSFWDLNEELGTRYDAKGTNHLTAAAGQIIAPPVYGSELIVNPGFETAGGGGTDVFGTWTESAGSGTIADETTAFHGGAHAAKITAGASLDTYIQQVFTVTSAASYYYSFWTRGDGTNAGRFQIYDVSNSANIVANGSTNITSTSYILVSGVFTAPAGCTSVRVYFRDAGVNGGIAYFDDVSLKQITTAAINNGGFDLVGAGGADVFASWTEGVSGTSTVNSENDAPYYGARAVRLDVDSSNSSVSVQMQNILSAGRKYKTTFWAKAGSGTPSVKTDSGVPVEYFTLSTSYQQFTKYFTAVSGHYFLHRGTGSGAYSIFIDQVTLESLGPTSDAGIPAGAAIDGNFAAQFNGTSQYLSHTDAATLDFDTADFALFGSFYRDKLGQSTIAAKYQDANNYYTLECNASNILTFRAYAGSTKIVEVIGTAALAVGNWYTFALVVDRSTAANCKLYVNGTNDTAGTPTTAATDISNTGAFEIGRYTTSLYFGGRIDGVGLLKRVLTAPEITALYNNGKGCKYATLPSTVSADLVSFWNLDERSVTRYDSCAAANDLTDNGTVTQDHGVDYNEGTVAKELDYSGNANTLAQATLAKRPVYDSVGIGGQAAVLFDGVDDLLMRAGDQVGTGDVTIFTVIKPRTWGGGTNGRILDNSKLVLSTNDTNDCINVLSDASTAAVSATNSIVAGTAYIVAVTRTSAGVTNIYISGSLSGSASQSSGTPVAGSDTYFGNRAAGDRAYDGWISELAVYHSILSTGQLNLVGAYLASKYGLTWAGL